MNKALSFDIQHLHVFLIEKCCKSSMQTFHADNVMHAHDFGLLKTSQTGIKIRRTMNSRTMNTDGAWQDKGVKPWRGKHQDRSAGNKAFVIPFFKNDI